MEVAERVKTRENELNWQPRTLDDIAVVTSSKRIFESDYVANGIPFYRGKEISDFVENQSPDELFFISEEKYLTLKSRFGAPKKDDILITAVGTLGNIYLVPNDHEFYFKDGNIIWVKNIRDELPKFVALQLSVRQAEILDDSIGSSQRALTIASLKKLNLLFPSLREQRAIAEALSDVDALISKLDALIAKKRAIKQGAMQQLLTGKTRLPGFKGEWEEKKLGEECELVTKGTTPTSIGKDFTSRGVNFIKIETLEENGKIVEERIAFIDSETNILLKRSQLKKNDLLVSIAGALGRVAIVNDSILPANTNQALAIIRLKMSSKIKHSFLFYYLNSLTIKKHIEAINVQAAQANLSLGNVGDFIVSFPSFDEQVAIASVLSDMDSDITTLEEKRDKTKALKQGMMQELLTGRIRLV